jgi:arylesterase/paraoxonase
LVATGLDLANGVDVSPDGHTLYVAETGKRRLQVFDRDVATGDLKPRDKVSLDSAPHNISVDADGNVWISAHPKSLSYMRTLEDSSARSPTQVLKYTPGAERNKQISEIYVNGGDELSSGSVVAARGNRLVIGSVVDHKLLLCNQEAAAVEAAKPAITGPERET